jgi:hypothetical protein
MIIRPHTGSTQAEVRPRDHPELFLPRKSILESLWPTPELIEWLNQHGGFWHVENDAVLVIRFANPANAALFKMTYA